MKTKSTLVTGICIILAVTTGLYVLNTQSAKAVPGGDSRTIYYELLEASYAVNAQGDVIATTHYKVFNTSPTCRIQIEQIHIIKSDSASSVDHKIWSGLAGTIIEPLGSITFSIEDTNTEPMTPGSPSGSHLIAVSWRGPGYCNVIGQIEVNDPSTGLNGIRAASLFYGPAGL